MYGYSAYGQNEYAGLTPTTIPPSFVVDMGSLGANGFLTLGINQGAVFPSNVVDMSTLGVNGRLTLLIQPDPSQASSFVDMETLGANGYLVLRLNKDTNGNMLNNIADAGELWKRVPRNL